MGLQSLVIGPAGRSVSHYATASPNNLYYATMITFHTEQLHGSYLYKLVNRRCVYVVMWSWTENVAAHSTQMYQLWHCKNSLAYDNYFEYDTLGHKLLNATQFIQETTMQVKAVEDYERRRRSRMQITPVFGVLVFLQTPRNSWDACYQYSTKAC